MIMEQWWNVTDSGKLMCWEKNIQYEYGAMVQCLLLLLLSVGPVESSRKHCCLPRLIVLTPLFGSPVHLQRRYTSDGVRDLYQRKEELMGEKWPIKFSLNNVTSTSL
jgi:hypothetical protein